MLIQQYSEGGDVIAIDNQLRLLYPHFIAHYTMLSQDEHAKSVFESLAPARGEVENAFRMIQANAANARQAEQERQEQEQFEMLQQQLRGDEGSVESKKILMDAVLAEKRDNMTEARKMRTESVAQLNQQGRAQVDAAIDVEAFKGEQARKNAETIAKIKRENALTAAKIKNQKATQSSGDKK